MLCRQFIRPSMFRHDSKHHRRRSISPWPRYPPVCTLLCAHIDRPCWTRSRRCNRNRCVCLVCNAIQWRSLCSKCVWCTNWFDWAPYSLSCRTDCCICTAWPFWSNHFWAHIDHTRRANNSPCNRIYSHTICPASADMSLDCWCFRTIVLCTVANFCTGSHLDRSTHRICRAYISCHTIPVSHKDHIRFDENLSCNHRCQVYSCCPVDHSNWLRRADPMEMVHLRVDRTVHRPDRLDYIRVPVVDHSNPPIPHFCPYKWSAAPRTVHRIVPASRIAYICWPQSHLCRNTWMANIYRNRSHWSFCWDWHMFSYCIQSHTVSVRYSGNNKVSDCLSNRKLEIIVWLI